MNISINELLCYEKYGILHFRQIPLFSRMAINIIDVNISWNDINRINSFLSFYNTLNPYC